MRACLSLSLVGALGLASPAISQNSFGEMGNGLGGMGQQQGVMPQAGHGIGQQQGFAQQPGHGQQPQHGQQLGGGSQFGQTLPPGPGGMQPRAGTGGAQPGVGSPQPGFGGTPQPGFGGAQPGAGAQGQMAAMFQQVAQYERQDHGIPPTDRLHFGQMHGPTPASIPGGRMVTTPELVQLVQSGQPYLLFDVLGSGQSLPGAIPAVRASEPGSFDDQVSQQFGQFLSQITGGNRDVPMIFYCASVQCWMSYNASLRAINLGYRNVLWYRGGIETWQAVGGPLVPAG